MYYRWKFQKRLESLFQEQNVWGFESSLGANEKFFKVFTMATGAFATNAKAYILASNSLGWLTRNR